MRISTSQEFSQQTYALDTLNAEQANYAQQLSSGKSLTYPSDNPTQIAEDISFRTDITVQTQVGNNLSSTQQQLTTVDSALANVTGVLQSARSLAVQGASDTLTPAQEQAIATQVDQLLQETVGFANTQYAGQYVFAGTAAPTSLPVQTVGSPISAVTFGGNEVPQTQTLPDGQTLTTSVTMRQAFNYGSADGSPDVFQTLINLRNTLQKQQVVDASSSQINLAGQSISNATTVSQLIGPPALMQTPLTADSTGNVSISIAGGNSPSGVAVTFLPGDTVANVVTKINAQTAATGVTASFNPQTEKIQLTGTGAFNVTDVPSAGATNSGNFTTAFGLQTTATLVNNLSRQIGDIDKVTSVLLDARANVGATIQRVQGLSSATSTTITNDTAVQSGIEDADIAKVTTQFTQTQTALQAAYGTTTRLEQKTLFDYVQ
ncbi:MAG TPA: flagellin hook IN motif-containing protein [Candidatus Dormibacteraeota bacterium]|nr:flagellin hook IN motif-containing protein [Candidatus Dormibacteraeota bacterium]